MLPLPTKITKDWQSSVEEEFRGRLIKNFVDSIKVPPEYLSAPLPQVVRKCEQICFERANTRSEYYHFIAEKVYKVQTALELRKFPMKATSSSEDGSSSSTQADNDVAAARSVEALLVEDPAQDELGKEMMELLKDLEKV